MAKFGAEINRMQDSIVRRHRYRLEVFFFFVDSSRASVIRQRTVRIKKKKRLWNVCFYIKNDCLCNAFSTLIGIPAMEAEIIPLEILKVLPYIPPTDDAVMPQAPSPKRIQRL